jgi:bifunctional enzyme CysN/CysC
MSEPQQAEPPRAPRQLDILRLATAGSVDDGKSTLIGRLLYDSKAILSDQYEHVRAVSEQRGTAYVDLALLTDGLRAEREQGITIDVAYRYFQTDRRKFILADTPGHIQYTRNMVTGASTADLAVILIDARKGVVEQTRRHAFLATLLRVQHLVVTVNKMDLVDWDETVYDAIVEDFTAFAAKLQVSDLTFIPISALHGDNVVERSTNADWYGGSPLLYHLEHVHIASDRNLIDPRFPVQWVIRPNSDEHHDYRGYAGQVASGMFRPGDEVIVLPSGRTANIKAIDSFDGELPQATPGMSVTMRLDTDVDVSRGDMICRLHNQPHVSRAIEAQVCWMNDEPMRPGGRYAIKHTSLWARVIVDDLRYRVDVNTLHRDAEATQLGLNEIGRVSLRTTQPLFFDEYRRNRTTGSFILVDESTNTTVGAGMILGPTE